MEKVVEIEVKGQKRFAPAYVINGETYLVSHQNVNIHFKTRKEAQEYFKD